MLNQNFHGYRTTMNTTTTTATIDEQKHGFIDLSPNRIGASGRREHLVVHVFFWHCGSLVLSLALHKMRGRSKKILPNGGWMVMTPTAQSKKSPWTNPTTSLCGDRMSTDLDTRYDEATCVIADAVSLKIWHVSRVNLPEGIFQALVFEGNLFEDVYLHDDSMKLSWFKQIPY